jgi:hypothetical protein
MGEWMIGPHFLDLSTSWVVSFTPRPLHPRYQLDGRLGGPQNRSGRLGEEKILDPTGTRTPTSRSSSPQPVAIPTTIFRLPIHTTYMWKFEIASKLVILKFNPQKRRLFYNNLSLIVWRNMTKDVSSTYVTSGFILTFFAVRRQNCLS